LKTTHKRSAIAGKGADAIGQVFPLDHAEVLKPGDGIVTQFERPALHIGEPAFKPAKIERVLFAGVYLRYRAWRPKLGTTPFRKHRKD
jgi:hypothetical protein